ncbi:hypothetical protein BD626DRAFT_564729 [Schizophyllum amplum]|uniref:Uncharacterized protein n=1 Tax=Schizophyllum amplum TaxID=97359 RepID=A0A550CSS4_9AGAR|nr:hypothetical protein BD626DRAFT_564729 [Auriculariopsis ampla]
MKDVFGISTLRNRTIENQKLYQSQKGPIYWRGPRGAVYMTAYYGLFAVGMASTTFGIYNLVFGSPTTLM